MQKIHVSILPSSIRMILIKTSDVIRLPDENKALTATIQCTTIAVSL